MNSLREKLLAANCQHKNTYLCYSPYETPSIGPTIEVCKQCGLSRSHWEQGESPWILVEEAKSWPVAHTLAEEEGRAI